MILKSKKIVVNLEDETGSATFVFAEPCLDKALDIQRLISKEIRSVDEQAEFWALILSDLIEIIGMFNEDGTPVTVVQFKKLNVPSTTMTALILARAAALNEASQKKV